MTRKKVTDPVLLAQLGESPRQKVTDPNLLAQLNSNNEEDEGAYLDNLPKPEGFLSKLPRNIGAGLAGLGHSTMNLPHDLVKGFESSTENLGKTLNQSIPLPKALQKKLSQMPKHERFRLSDYIPHQQKYDFAKMLGQKGEGTLMDNLIQKGIEYAPEIAGGTGLLRRGARMLKGTHQLDEVGKSIFQHNQVKNLLNDKNLVKFDYPHDMIAKAKKFLPPTEATKELINAAQSGNYKAAFKLQSQIGHHQRQLLRSPLASENSIMAPKAGELKQNMLDHLESVMRKEGLTETADLLKGGINNYRVYKKVENAVTPVLKKLGIPVTILSALGFGYKKAMKALSD